MKRNLLLLSIAVLAVSGCFGSRKDGPTIEDMMARYDWAGTVDEGMRMAERLNKPAILFFYHGLCWGCRSLLLDVAADVRAADLLDHFVFIAVNLSTDRPFFKRYGVKKVPDVRYLSPSGEMLDKMNEQSPEAIADQLERILEALDHHRSHSLDSKGTRKAPRYRRQD